jgi:hypothetical protein
MATRPRVQVAIPAQLAKLRFRLSDIPFLLLYFNLNPKNRRSPHKTPLGIQYEAEL